MAPKQRHRAPKLKTAQHMFQERTSSATLEPNSIHKEDQAVEEKQSYAMITGLLQVLVASIAYQRNLFPKTCFEMRLPSVIRAEAHRSYGLADARSNKTSSDNEMAKFATALAQRDQPLIVLAPGKTNGANKLLAWLDEIFKGLLDRSLDGVQFSIYADKSRPSQILELYTFSFRYRNGKDGDRSLIGLTAPGCGSDTITTRSVRTGMVNMINQLHDYQQQLPALPKKRYLMCHLFQSSYAPWHHQPPGFHSCIDSNMAVLENGLWYMKQRSLGSIDSGIHCVRLEIGFMARADNARDLEDESMLAQNTEHTRTVSRILKPDYEKQFLDQDEMPVGTRTIKRPRGSFTREDEHEDLIRLEEVMLGKSKDSGKPTRAMKWTMSPGPFSEDSGESTRTHNTLSGDSLLPTQVMEVHDPPALTWNWKLRAGKRMEMSVKRDKKQWTAARDDRVVRCECCCDGEELAMVSQLQCICCQKLQHYHCYGFAIEMYVHEHHCYQCLLEDTHGALLGDMKSLAIFRRALWVLYEKTPSTAAEFAQTLHLDGKTTQGLIERLDEGGYLASGRTRLSPVTTREQTIFRSQLYHNPLTSISGFYEPRENAPSANTETEDKNPRRKRIKS